MPSQPLFITAVMTGHVVADGRGQLLERHLEAAVTVDVDRRSPPDGPAWRPIAAGRPNPIVPSPPEVMNERGPVAAQVLRGPHLVLTDAGGPDRLAIGEHLAQPLDHELRLERPDPPGR
jgi:hypothetical protein